MSTIQPFAQSSRGALRVRALTLLAACLMLVPALLASAAGTAHAGEDRPQRGQAFAGSTIPKHENQEGEQPERRLAAQPQGIDVSHWQGNINWSQVRNDGIRFAYIKATEGTYYTDPRFDENYVESYNQGVIRGAYHFAIPNDSSGAAQARFFNNNGGGWSADGKTLPPMLDMEYNPYGADCYGKTDAQMVRWIRNFSNTTKELSGRYPVIYTTRDWWVRCTGNTGAFNDTNPLMIARWGPDPYPLPNWPFWTMWQYTSKGSVAGISGNVDRDVFNGSMDRLRAFATCTNENPCRLR